MVAVSHILLASTTLFALGQAAIAPRETSTSTSIPWNSSDTETVMALIGTGYPVSCDSDCDAFAEALATELGLAVGSASTNSSSPSVTALCVSSFYEAVEKCGNCISTTAPKSNITLSFPSYINEFNAECNASISLSGGSSTNTSISFTGGTSSHYTSIGWATLMGLAIVAGFSSLS